MVAEDVWAEAVRLVVEEGVSAREASRRLGVNRTGIAEHVAAAGWRMRGGRHGGLRYMPEGHYVDEAGHITFSGRMVIQIRLGDGWTQTRIAAAVGVSRSAVCKEIAKHRGTDGPYDATTAHAQMLASRARPREGKLDDPDLRRVVVWALNQKWSPEEIAGWLVKTFFDDETMWVSHETIYQALYVQGRGSLREELRVEHALRTHRTGRKPRSKLPSKRGNKSWITENLNISQRPAEVEDRAVPGHWEGDLVLGTGNKSALITLVERTTRYTLVSRLPFTHDAVTVADRLIEMMSQLPEHLRRSLTWDQGSEMAQHPVFTLATDTKVFFCDPHSPWLRGTNENTNGLIRDYYPKGTDFRDVTDDDIDTMQQQLNGRPRKTLQWDSPAERITELLRVATAA